MKLFLWIWLASALAAFGETQFAFTNFAGFPGASGTSDGTGSGARFAGPFSTGRENTGDLCVADYYNHTIRRVSAAAVVTTVAGTALSSGTNDGPISSARFYQPDGVAEDSAGNLYVADTSNHTIRKIAAGMVSTLAGAPGQLGTANGTGSAARFYLPAGLAVDNTGNVYVADRYNHAIRKVTPAGVVTTVAGLVSPGGAGTNDGTGTAARFRFPSCLIVNSATNLIVADSLNHTLRMITPVGTNWAVTTIAGLAGVTGITDGAGNAARFNVPRGLAFDAAGDLYVADSNNHTIRKLSLVGTNWVVTTLAGLAGQSGSTGGTNGAARFYGPRGIVFDTAGNMYVADSGNYRISKGFLLGGPVAPPILGAATVISGLFQLSVTNSAPGSPVIIESFTDETGWLPLMTNTAGAFDFSEPVIGPSRLYRAYLRQ